MTTFEELQQQVSLDIYKEQTVTELRSKMWTQWHVIDENQSVNWNRAMVAQHNANIEAEIQLINVENNKKREAFRTALYEVCAHYDLTIYQVDRIIDEIADRTGDMCCANYFYIKDFVDELTYILSVVKGEEVNVI